MPADKKKEEKKINQRAELRVTKEAQVSGTKADQLGDTQKKVEDKIDLGTFNKKKIIKELGERMVGQKKFKSVRCEDGATYDIEIK